MSVFLSTTRFANNEVSSLLSCVPVFGFGAARCGACGGGAILLSTGGAVLGFDGGALDGFVGAMERLGATGGAGWEISCFGRDFRLGATGGLPDAPPGALLFLLGGTGAFLAGGVGATNPSPKALPWTSRRRGGTAGAEPEAEARAGTRALPEF